MLAHKPCYGWYFRKVLLDKHGNLPKVAMSTEHLHFSTLAPKLLYLPSFRRGLGIFKVNLSADY